MWNIGRATRLTLSEQTPNASVMLTAFHSVIPWVIMAPFGRPVVPEVYMMVRTVSRLVSTGEKVTSTVARASS